MFLSYSFNDATELHLLVATRLHLKTGSILDGRLDLGQAWRAFSVSGFLQPIATRAFRQGLLLGIGRNNHQLPAELRRCGTGNHVGFAP